MVDGLEGRSPSEFPLGAEQRRFLFLHQLNPASPEIYITCIIHVRGRLDAPAVRHALAFVVQRHDVLRATFQAVQGTSFIASARRRPSSFRLSA